MTDQKLTTPIAFLIFNRPDTTQRVFDEIRKARPTRLYVAADGPRKHVTTDAARCDGARKILHQIDWPCDVHTLLRDENLGCKRAVSSALDWFFEHEPEGIVLEDDCVPTQDFFRFCLQMLEYYRETPRVKMISGSNPLLDTFPASDSYVFSRYFSVWGWATWKRVWEEYDIEMSDWPRLKETDWLRGLFSPPYMQRHMETTFDLVRGGRINTWDVQFVYSCLRNDGIAIAPSLNLISNIGVEGTHTAPEDTVRNFLPVFELDVDNLKHPCDVIPNSRYDLLVYERLFKPTARALLRRTFFRAKRRLMSLRLGQRSNTAHPHVSGGRL